MRKLISVILLSGTVAAGAGRAEALNTGARPAPLFFTPNRGQAPRGVRFQARTPHLTAYFSRGEAQFRAAAGSIRMSFEGARAVDPEARGRAHDRIRSPAGSCSGSAATTPATHSPKISTATSVPISAAAAGKYAYAIDFPTV